METAQGSDKEIGFAVLFGALGVLGALAMLFASVGGTQVMAAWGFAFAMAASTLAVTVFHVYD